MICKNCKKEATGNFCCHCGAPLIEITPPEEFLEAEPTKNLEAMEKKKTVSKASANLPPKRNLSNLELDDLEETWQEEEEKVPVKKEKPASSPRYPSRQKTVIKKTVTKAKPKTKPKTRTIVKKQPAVKTKVKRKSRPAFKLPVKQTVNSAGKLLSLALRAGSFLMMVLILLELLPEFWMQRNLLGNMTSMAAERNYAEGVYLLLAAALSLYCLFSALWIVSQRKMVSDSRLKGFDTGRGVLPFLVFFLLALLSDRLVYLIPSAPAALQGVTQILGILAMTRKKVLIYCVIGIACCIVRKVKKG